MRRIALGTLALATLVAGCAPAPTAATSTAAATSAAAPYLRRELVDVRTNEKFTLASLVGKVVIVEGMAVW